MLGTVTSNPGGINCGPVCAGQQATFGVGATVTLSASAVAGVAFTGWEGDCSGTSCVVSMTADRSVVARYRLLTRPAGEAAPEPGTQASLRTRLLLQGGRGDVLVDGRTVFLAGGSVASIAFGDAAGDHVVEAWAREGTGEGVWRFDFGSGDAAGRRILNVLAGDPLSLTPEAVVFRVKGRFPQKVAFVVRLAPGPAVAPPGR
jgi:hypothetical protein